MGAKGRKGGGPGRFTAQKTPRSGGAGVTRANVGLPARTGVLRIRAADRGTSIERRSRRGNRFDLKISTAAQRIGAGRTIIVRDRPAVDKLLQRAREVALRGSVRRQVQYLERRGMDVLAGINQSFRVVLRYKRNDRDVRASRTIAVNVSTNVPFSEDMDAKEFTTAVQGVLQDESSGNM